MQGIQSGWMIVFIVGLWPGFIGGSMPVGVCLVGASIRFVLVSVGAQPGIIVGRGAFVVFGSGEGGWVLIVSNARASRRIFARRRQALIAGVFAIILRGCLRGVVVGGNGSE